MRRAAIAATCVLLVLVSALAVRGGPLNPIDAERGFLSATLEPFSVRTFGETCKAEERTMIMAIGRGNSPIAVYVFDPQGNCIAWDDLALNRKNVSDDIALAWHPPREMRYDIELRNFGRESNLVEFTIR